MNTMQSDLTATLEGFRTDMAKRETDAVKREKQQLLAIAGLISLATIVIGLLVRLPG